MTMSSPFSSMRIRPSLLGLAVGCAVFATIAGCAVIAGLDEHTLEGAPPDAAQDSPADTSADLTDGTESGNSEAGADSPVDVSQEPVPDASDDGAEAGRDADSGEASPETDADASEVEVDAAEEGVDAPEEPDSAHDAGPQVVTDTIWADEDDGMWIQCGGSPSDERLYYAAGDKGIFVSDDTDNECAGVRFHLSIPKGAVIDSAIITLHLYDWSTSPGDTMRVRVFDSGSTPPFHDNHTEPAVQHDPAGVWSSSVDGWEPGATGGPVKSPDLSTLVQHVIGLPSWESDGAQGTIAFLITPQSMYNTYVGFEDSASGTNPPSISVTYHVP